MIRALARRLRRYVPPALLPAARALRRYLTANDYAGRLWTERANFDGQSQVHDLPPIFHYWSNKYLRPMLEAMGSSNPDAFFARHLLAAARAHPEQEAQFLSIGAGNCDTEIRIAASLKSSGLNGFVIECLELSPPMLARGRALADTLGLLEHLKFTQGDFNRWQPARRYHAVIANQSLHHVIALEQLFDGIRHSLEPEGLLVVSDMIGRNGHLRWPEAEVKLQKLWQELPTEYRYNQQLQRHEARFQDWDCAQDGCEGIRAQDVLRNLLQRFHPQQFIAHGNLIDVFVDRSFGHHFRVERDWDRAFIDKVHAMDEALLLTGELTPTRLIASFGLREAALQSARNLQPWSCVRPA